MRLEIGLSTNSPSNISEFECNQRHIPKSQSKIKSWTVHTKICSASGLVELAYLRTAVLVVVDENKNKQTHTSLCCYINCNNGAKARYFSLLAHIYSGIKTTNNVHLPIQVYLTRTRTRIPRICVSNRTISTSTAEMDRMRQTTTATPPPE